MSTHRCYICFTLYSLILPKTVGDDCDWNKHDTLYVFWAMQPCILFVYTTYIKQGKTLTFIKLFVSLVLSTLFQFEIKHPKLFYI